MKELVYQKRGPLELKLLIWAEEQGEDARAPRPAMVQFHGGGWVGGSAAGFERFCRYFAECGMVAISVQYRLMGDDPSVSPLDCFDDAKAAYRYVLEHADKLGIDPAAVVLGGGSAGGHLATAVVTFNDDGLPPPRALVLFNPAFDLSEEGWAGGRDRVLATGRDPLAFSPAHHVAAPFPPTYIVHGTADKTVPIDTVRRFRKTVEAFGGDCQLIEFPGRAHGFYHGNGNIDGNGDDLRTTLVHAKSFLHCIGVLKEAQVH